MTNPAPQPQTRYTVGQTLTVALAIALLGGTIEGLFGFLTQYGLETTGPVGLHAVWLAPLMNLVWLAVPLSVLAVVAKLRGADPGWVAGVPALVALLGLTLFLKTVHPAAAAILALGMAVVVARFVRARPTRVLRGARWLLPALLLGLGLAGPAAIWYRNHQERAQLRAHSPAPAGAPNVLLLVIDTGRAASMSVAGYDRPTTPQLDRLARESVRFDEAWSPSSWTLSSLASMFTGRLPHEVSANLQSALDDADPTLAERMGEQGYATAGFIANLHFGVRAFGLDRGFGRYQQYHLGPGEAMLNSAIGRYLARSQWLHHALEFEDIFGRINAETQNRRLLRWLDRPRDRPFFGFVLYYDVHEPYLPPEEWDRRFASATPRKLYLTNHSVRGARRLQKMSMTPAEVSREREAYEASIAYLDDQIGKLVDSLRTRGILDNTILIVTADHGEQFGEHDLFVHGNSLYRPVMRVPLLIRAPGRVPADVEVTTPVSTRNLAATILDLTNAGPAKTLPGMSLRSLWEGPVDSTLFAPRIFEVTVSRADVIWSMASDGWYYIRHRDGSEELYWTPTDPEQERDLIADSTRSRTLADLRQAFDSAMMASGPPRWRSASAPRPFQANGDPPEKADEAQ